MKYIYCIDIKSKEKCEKQIKKNLKKCNKIKEKMSLEKNCDEEKIELIDGPEHTCEDKIISKRTEEILNDKKTTEIISSNCYLHNCSKNETRNDNRNCM